MLNFVAAEHSTDGVSILDYLHAQAAERDVSSREATNLARRLWAHISEVGHLDDEFQAEGRAEPPTAPEIAKRWSMPERTVYGLNAEVRALLGDEAWAAHRELWAGIEKQATNDGGLMPMAAVRVMRRGQ